MKRLWIGLSVLAALLAFAIFLNIGMDRLHTALSQELDRAGQLALEEQWEETEETTRKAYRQWLHYRHMLAAVVDHEPLEEMEHLFSQLWVYRDGQWAKEYAATCVRLARQAEAIGDSHILTWWNLL